MLIFDSRTSMEERSKAISQLKSSKIQNLVTIRLFQLRHNLLKILSSLVFLIFGKINRNLINNSKIFSKFYAQIAKMFTVKLQKNSDLESVMLVIMLTSMMMIRF